MKFFAALALISLCFLAGCGHGNKNQTQSQSAVSKFRTTTLPVPPEVPDTEPVTTDIKTATSEVKAGQSNVQDVIKMAQGNPAGAAVLPALNSADTHLELAQAQLASALEKSAALQKEIEELDKVHKEIEKIKDDDLESLKKAAATDNKQLSNEVKSLAKENDDLKNEAMRSARNRLMWMGVLLMIAGAGSIVASIFLGFTIGPKLAPIFLLCGSFLITLSQILPKIVYYTEVGFGIGTVGLLTWLLWHTFHHVPQSKDTK